MCAVLYEKQDNYVTLTIDHPPMNALSRSVLSDLNDCLNQIEADENMKAVIIQGAGKHFSAGADIKELVSLQNKDAYRALSVQANRLFDRIEQFSIPIIAAIQGAALGGGLELAMACQMRIVTKHATLGLPELTLGVIPGYGGTYRLPMCVGFAKASEMILTGEPVNGEEAVRLGLANQVVENTDLSKATLELTKKITDKSKVATSAALKLLTQHKASFKQDPPVVANAFARMFESEDAMEGIQAFIDKRSPEFKNK